MRARVRVNLLPLRTFKDSAAAHRRGRSSTPMQVLKRSGMSAAAKTALPVPAPKSQKVLCVFVCVSETFVRV